MPKQIQSNQTSKQLEIIAEGVLLKYFLFEDGSQESLDVLSKGDILGEHLLLGEHSLLKSPHLLDNSNYADFHTMALTEVKKCNFPIEVIQPLFEENKQFSQALLQALSHHLIRLQINAMKVRTLNGIEKVEFVYRVLKNLNVDLNIITQEDLVLIVGVSRNTVVRAMKQIQHQS